MRPQRVSGGGQLGSRLPLTWAARSGRWLLPLLAALSACTYDSAEELLSHAPPAPTCDSLAVSFSASVAPLLQQRCVSCHNAGLRNGDVSLETYAQVQRVATDGRLVGVIAHAQGYSPMPQNGPKLSDCEIARIRQWVRSGMPNN